MHELVHALQDQYVNLDSLEHISGRRRPRSWPRRPSIEGRGDVRPGVHHGRRHGATSPRSCRAAGNRFANGALVAQRRSRCSRRRRWSSRRRCSFRTSTARTSSAASRRASRASCRFDDLPVSHRTADARLGVLRHARATCRARSRCRRFRGRSTRTTSVNSARGSFLYAAHRRIRIASIRASIGWDGDRYALVKTPAGNALAWVTVWDRPATRRSSCRRWIG